MSLSVWMTQGLRLDEHPLLQFLEFQSPEDSATQVNTTHPQPRQCYPTLLLVPVLLGAEASLVQLRTHWHSCQSLTLGWMCSFLLHAGLFVVTTVSRNTVFISFSKTKGYLSPSPRRIVETFNNLKVLQLRWPFIYSFTWSYFHSLPFLHSYICYTIIHLPTFIQQIINILNIPNIHQLVERGTFLLLDYLEENPNFKKLHFNTFIFIFPNLF